MPFWRCCNTDAQSFKLLNICQLPVARPSFRISSIKRNKHFGNGPPLDDRIALLYGKLECLNLTYEAFKLSIQNKMKDLATQICDLSAEVKEAKVLSETVSKKIDTFQLTLEGFKEELQKVNVFGTLTSPLEKKNIEPNGTLQLTASQHNSYRPEQFHTSTSYTGYAHPNQLVHPVNPSPPSFTLAQSKVTSAPYNDHLSSRRS